MPPMGMSGMSGDPAMNNGLAANSGDPAGSGCSPGAVDVSAMYIPDGGCCNSGAQCMSMHCDYTTWQCSVPSANHMHHHHHHHHMPPMGMSGMSGDPAMNHDPGMYSMGMSGMSGDPAMNPAMGMSG